MRIVLAVDGSEGSYDAARAIAHLFPAQELTILYAVDVPRLAYPATTPGLQTDFALKMEHAMRDEGARILDRAAGMVGPDPGPTDKRIEAGTAAEVILAAIDRVRADLIVLGSRGLSQISELLLGSVSHRITTHASCSTLVVKSAMPRLHHILLPVESQEDAEVAIAFLAKTPFREAAIVTVLHVLPIELPAWPVGTVIPDSLRQEMLREADNLVSAVASRLSSLKYHASGRVKVGAPSVIILQEASTAGADVILMRSTIRPGLSRFFLGSVSHAVVHQASCSVLLVKYCSLGVDS